MLDEPLGSLDRPRRDELTEELRSLLRRVGVTVLHVTHDHDEAFAVADRVAVMQSGRNSQDRHPGRHLARPPPGRRGPIPGPRQCGDRGRGRSGALGSFASTGGPGGGARRRLPPRGRPAPDTDAVVTGTVADARFRGDRFELTLRTDPGEFELLVRDPSPAAVGDRLHYAVDPAKIAGLEAGEV